MLYSGLVTGIIHALSSGQLSLASGNFVRIEGYDYLSGEYRAIAVTTSGEMAIHVTVEDVVRARISGDMVLVASGLVGIASGLGVVARITSGIISLPTTQAVKVSGETVSIETPIAIKTGALLRVIAGSGGTIVTSGAVKTAIIKSASLSADVFVGGSVAGQMPYSGFGFLLAQGEATSLDIDNFGRARVCANLSGDFVSFMGVN